MTADQLARAAAEREDQGDARRCHEITRTTRGYERCHRDEHDPGTPHHVRDRSWYTGPAPRLKLGQPCRPDCRWPEHLVPYLGTAPRSEGGTVRARRQR